jgi:hypothetical protein
MNCLNEALGLGLPGNGTLLATHAMRWELFEAAAKRIVHSLDGCHSSYIHCSRIMRKCHFLTKLGYSNVYKIKSRNFGIASGGGHCPRMPHRPTLLWFSFAVLLCVH